MGRLLPSRGNPIARMDKLALKTDKLPPSRSNLITRMDNSS